MSEQSGAPAGDIAAPAIESSEISLSQARQLLNSMPDGAEFKDAGESPTAESAEPATAETELPERATSDPETDPADKTNEPDPAEQPLIERPRSWAKELDEEWASYPREAQQKIAKREQERDAAIRRSQNEAADARKAAEAQAAEAQKVKQQYEAQLPQLMQELQNAYQSSFSDIKTLEDAAKLQAEDPFRFQAWQVHQMRLQAAKQETDRVQGEQAQAKLGKRAAYEAEQNKLLVEFVPEMADPKKASELRERAIGLLTDDLGLKNDQLSRWYADDTGHEILSNAGIQKLIADGLKYRDLLAAPKAAVKPNTPPVQRPGVARPAGAQDSEHIQTLEKRLNQTGSEKDAWALYEAKLKANTRRAS